MVTRKTRLLSAVAAVLMLVSMFTCFVLPAVAEVTLDPNAPVEWPAESLLAYSSRTATLDATAIAEGGALGEDGRIHYAITNATDWLNAVKDSNKSSSGPYNASVASANRVYCNFANVSLWLTNDIDFGSVAAEAIDNRGEIMMCIRKGASNAFQGHVYGQGYSFKNLNVDLKWEHDNGNYTVYALIGRGRGSLIRDLTIDESCSFNYTCTGVKATSDMSIAGTEFYLGIFMAACSSKQCTFINCHNEADFTFTDLNDGTVNANYTDKETGIHYTDKIKNVTHSMSTFGRHDTYGVALINCSNSGNFTNNDKGRATGLSEWTNVASILYNCYNTGAMSACNTDGYDFQGAVSTNNSTASAVEAMKLANCYSVGESFACGPRSYDTLAKMGPTLEAGADASGELAWLLNKNYVSYTGVERVYYSVKDGKHVIGATAAEQPVKLNVTLGAVTDTIYAVADAEGKIDLNVAYPLEGGVYMVDGVELENGILTATPGGEVDITATSTANVYTYLQEKLDWFKTETIAYYADAEGTVLTQAYLDEIQGKITADSYEDQAAVDAELAKLEGFVFNEDAIVAWADREKYPDALNIGIATKAEMDELAVYKGEFTVDHVIHITDDIDMQGSLEALNPRLSGLKASINGHGHAIKNLWLEASWLQHYTGKFIKDLTFEGGGYQYAGSTAFLIQNLRNGTETLLSNITLDGVVGTCDAAATTGANQGLLVTLVDDAKLTLRDIKIVNCTLNRPNRDEEADRYWNSGLVLGKTYSGVIDADGIYLNNNTITGLRTAGGTGVVFGEIICDATVKNVTVLNTTTPGDKYMLGVMAGMAKWGIQSDSAKDYGDVTCYNPHMADPEIIFENIIAYNNGEQSNLVYVDKNYPTTVKVTNAYTDTSNIFSAEYESGVNTNYHDGENQYSGETYAGTVAENAHASAAAAILGGAAAYDLNAKGATKLAMDGTTPIFAGANDKAPVAVTFKALDAVLKDAEAPIATYVLYTDKDGKLIGLADILDAASWDNEAGLAEAVFDAEAVVIGYTAPEHDHQYAYADNGDGTHTVACAFYHNSEEYGVLTCNYKAIADHETEKKNVTATDTEEVAATHQVVDVCKYCVYESTEATDCAGSLSPLADETWDASCAGAGRTTTVCDACDYKHVKAHAQLPHSWSDWAQVGDTDTHMRSCANAAVCLVPDEVEPCDFGEEGVCKCGNKAPVLVELDSGIAVIGKELEVTVDLKDNHAKLAGVTLEIAYNADVLTLKDAQNGTWNATFAKDFPAASGETTVLLNLVSAADMEGDGTLLKLIFDVKDDRALSGTSTEIKVNVAEMKDAELAPVESKGDSITVEIRTSMIKGDINGDQIVNMVDAILLLRYVSGTELPEGMAEMIDVEIADLTDEGDGVDLGDNQTTPEINVNDVIYLLRYLNGWIVEL